MLIFSEIFYFIPWFFLFQHLEDFHHHTKSVASRKQNHWTKLMNVCLLGKKYLIIVTKARIFKTIILVHVVSQLFSFKCASAGVLGAICNPSSWSWLPCRVPTAYECQVNMEIWIWLKVPWRTDKRSGCNLVIDEITSMVPFKLVCYKICLLICRDSILLIQGGIESVFSLSLFFFSSVLSFHM